MDSRFPQKQNTSGKLKARQYGAAGFICLFIAVVMTVIRFIWGDIMLGSGGDSVSLSMVIFLVRNLVLIFGAIDLISAAYHFMLWNRNGRKCMDDVLLLCGFRPIHQREHLHRKHDAGSTYQ